MLLVKYRHFRYRLLFSLVQLLAKHITCTYLKIIQFCFFFSFELILIRSINLSQEYTYPRNITLFLNNCMTLLQNSVGKENKSLTVKTQTPKTNPTLFLSDNVTNCYKLLPSLLFFHFWLSMVFDLGYQQLLKCL